MDVEDVEHRSCVADTEFRSDASDFTLYSEDMLTAAERRELEDAERRRASDAWKARLARVDGAQKGDNEAGLASSEDMRTVSALCDALGRVLRVVKKSPTTRGNVEMPRRELNAFTDAVIRLLGDLQLPPLRLAQYVEDSDMRLASG